MKRLSLAAIALLGCLGMAAQPNPGSLVPDTPSKAPDYYCTWNIQGFVCSYSFGRGSNDLRAEMNEDNLFGRSIVHPGDEFQVKDNEGKPFTVKVQPDYKGWLYHYPSIQKDLFFVMDDSWDIPIDANSKRPHGNNYDNEFLARLVLDGSRFPTYQGGTDAANMRRLVQDVKKIGWKGLGGWVCMQDPICLTQEYTGLENNRENSMKWTENQEKSFWTKKLAEMKEAGFSYWKLDWGNKDRNDKFRANLSKWQEATYPGLIMEHAMKNQYITFSNTFRTYDVDNNDAQAETIKRIVSLLSYKADPGYGIINCEDEPYIAAGLGCAIGVMRHPFVGDKPNGKPDAYFQEQNAKERNIKHRLNEIVRGVRWHRIAEPFRVDGEFKADAVKLFESGTGGKRSGRTSEAPAIVSRHLPLPVVKGGGENRPFVLASLYDNGCTAVAAINRNIEGVYQKQKVSVTVEPQRWDRKVGIFGYYKSLTLKYQDGLPDGAFKVYAQDLAVDGSPVDITGKVKISKGSITLPGAVIEELCKGHDYPYTEVKKQADRSYFDVSDPGIVLLVVK